MYQYTSLQDPTLSSQFTSSRTCHFVLIGLMELKNTIFHNHHIKFRKNQSFGFKVERGTRTDTHAHKHTQHGDFIRSFLASESKVGYRPRKLFT